MRVLVLEKRLHPVREAAFKVGESSVEIGAHYFRSVLELEPVLRSQHLEKLGLRYFFPQGSNDDISRRTELGPPAFPIVPSFQLDRGRLENWLLASVRDSGVEVIDDCAVKRIELKRGAHTVEFAGPGGSGSVQARWLVDASGRCGLIRRQLGLTRAVTHGANAAWFRVKERVKVDDWSEDPAWKARVPTGERWLSTNHLMGRGYWTWLIPLGSGSTSIGIVADDDLHPFSRINRYERAVDWLREFEPQCARVVESLEDRLEDFLALKHFAHGCQRVISPDGWSLVGEAGVFTDPFYSPGSDFIAIGNDLTTDLIDPDGRGRGRHRTRRGVQRHLPSPVRGVPAALRRSVPAHGQRAGHDRQGGVGQRVLLGYQCAALLPAPLPRSGVHGVDRPADAAILRAARAHAATPSRLGSRGNRPVRGRLHQRHVHGEPVPAPERAGRAPDGRRRAAADTRAELRVPRALRASLAGAGGSHRSQASPLRCTRDDGADGHLVVDVQNLSRLPNRCKFPGWVCAVASGFQTRRIAILSP